jgi:hypothetical protein
MAFLDEIGLRRLWMNITSKLGEKLNKAGDTMTGDLKLSDGTNQRKFQIYRTIQGDQFELQHSVDYEGKGFIGIFKAGSRINLIELGENNTKFHKPIVVDGGATGDVAMQTRANLGIESLPTATSDDAGKFLRVQSDGTWAAENAQDLLVTDDGNGNVVFACSIGTMISDENTYLTVNN